MDTFRSSLRASTLQLEPHFFIHDADYSSTHNAVDHFLTIALSLCLLGTVTAITTTPSNEREGLKAFEKCQACMSCGTAHRNQFQNAFRTSTGAMSMARISSPTLLSPSSLGTLSPGVSSQLNCHHGGSRDFHSWRLTNYQTITDFFAPKFLSSLTLILLNAGNWSF